MKALSRLIPALALVSLTLPGTAGAEEKGAPPARPRPLRVAVMPLMNVTQEVLADQVVSQALRDRLKEFDSDRAMFLFPADVERVLSARDESYRAYRIAQRWSMDNTLDSTAVEGLDTLLTVDAILCVRISDWEVKRITVINAGQSYTTVGLQFALFDVRNKQQLWKKDAREQRYAPEYDVSSGTVSYDATGTIQSRGTNEPPRPKEVVGDLVRSAFRKFPQS
ncbi:MAG TPA: hypothetical protein VID50_02775 [Candidatus Eisenbacteria bacterium]